MLNLLPKEHRKLIRREYIRRFLIVALSLFSLVVISWAVAIFPMYTSVNSDEVIVGGNLASIKNSSLGKDRSAVINGIKDLEAKMKLISIVPGDGAVEFISKATDLKTANISISSVSYTKKDASHKVVVIEGAARTRNDLISFFKKAKQVSWATASDVPLSSLAGEKNIPFTMSLDITSSK